MFPLSTEPFLSRTFGWTNWQIPDRGEEMWKILSLMHDIPVAITWRRTLHLEAREFYTITESFSSYQTLVRTSKIFYNQLYTPYHTIIFHSSAAKLIITMNPLTPPKTGERWCALPVGYGVRWLRSCKVNVTSRLIGATCAHWLVQPANQTTRTQSVYWLLVSYRLIRWMAGRGADWLINLISMFIERNCSGRAVRDATLTLLSTWVIGDLSWNRLIYLG